MTEATGLDQFLDQLLANHEAAVAVRDGLVFRWHEERAQREAVRKYAEIAEVDRRTARSTVRRLHRQLLLLDDRGVGVLDPVNVEQVARALVLRCLGVQHDPAVEEAEVTYGRIEEVRHQIPLAYSWKRARGEVPEDEVLRALERELDGLERRYAEIWVRWVTS